MKKCGLRNLLTMFCVVTVATGCAVRPVPDPRNPGPVRDSPLLLRVCHVDGDGAHLTVGDQVELATNKLGRLRIRHILSPDNSGGAWNAGDDAAVKSSVLVELIDPRGDKTNTRRFVPVGRFSVRVGERSEHARFDFLASKATDNLTNNRYPECNVDLGDDEFLVRGVEDDERHGGTAHVR
jgi:hypothetical protein